MASSGAWFCYYKPERPCVMPRCIGDPQDYDAHGNLKTNGFVYGGSNFRSEKTRRRLAWANGQCHACFRHSGNGEAQPTQPGPEDSSSDSAQDSAKSKEHDQLGEPVHSVSDESSSMIARPDDLSNTEGTGAARHSPSAVLALSTVGSPMRVAPIQRIFNEFFHTDRRSVTSVYKSMAGLRAWILVCEMSLLHSNSSAMERAQTEVDLHTAEELYKTMSDVFSGILQYLSRPQVPPAFAKCIRLGLENINAVTQSTKNQTRDAYLRETMALFKSSVALPMAQTLTTELLRCLRLWKVAEHGDASAAEAYKAAFKRFSTHIRLSIAGTP